MHPFSQQALLFRNLSRLLSSGCGATLQVAVLRLLKQLSQVYSVMKIERLKQLIPFMNFGQVEAIVVDAVKNEYIQVRLPPLAVPTPSLLALKQSTLLLSCLHCF